MFASATIAPNWIISGSFWNCGAPPDSEIAVAIAKRAEDARRQRRGEGGEPVGRAGRAGGDARAWKTASVDDGDDREVREVERELDGRDCAR